MAQAVHNSKLFYAAALTEEESGDRALELEEVPDDGSASAWSNGGGVHSSDVGEALGVLSIDGVPHQTRSPKQCVLCPACNVKMHDVHVRDIHAVQLTTHAGLCSYMSLLR